MNYTLYILRCKDGTLYTGIALDIEKRIAQHNGMLPGGAKYTRGRAPVKVVYSEVCSSRSAALKREREVKKLSREAKLALIRTYSRR